MTRNLRMNASLSLCRFPAIVHLSALQFSIIFILLMKWQWQKSALSNLLNSVDLFGFTCGSRQRERARTKITHMQSDTPPFAIVWDSSALRCCTTYLHRATATGNRQWSSMLREYENNCKLFFFSRITWMQSVGRRFALAATCVNEWMNDLWTMLCSQKKREK